MDEFINKPLENENNTPENNADDISVTPSAPFTGFGDNEFSVKNFEDTAPSFEAEEGVTAELTDEASVQADNTEEAAFNSSENYVSEESEPTVNTHAFNEPAFNQDGAPQQNTPPFPPFYNQQTYNPVSFTEVKPVKEYKPMSKGLKFFALIMSFVILLTGSTAVGYFIGKKGVESIDLYGDKVSVNLASRPKKTDEMTEAEVYEAVNKSIVGIIVYNNNGKSSQASGIVYTKDGYIVTNDHIYSDISAPKFKIYTYDGTEYNAKYIAGDLISDLAVLKVDAKDFTPAEFGNSNELFYGEHVVAIGRPSDATDKSSITRGIISAVSRRVRTTSNYTSSLIQTDSAINPGSSGGALLNMYGQVIGVTSSKLASVEYDAVGYAIPTVTMKRIVEELIENGKVISRAKLGVTYTAIDSVTAEINNYDYVGLRIASVSEDSDLLGKVEEGDTITHINGKAVVNDEVVLDIIDQSLAGDTITVTVVTNSGKTKTVEAVLKANIGESSYNATESLKENDDKDNRGEKDDDSEDGPTFNFPFGE